MRRPDGDGTDTATERLRVRASPASNIPQAPIFLISRARGHLLGPPVVRPSVWLCHGDILINKSELELGSMVQTRREPERLKFRLHYSTPLTRAVVVLEH